MNKVESFVLFSQNSYGKYTENKLIEDVKTIISPFAGIHQESINYNIDTINIPTTLHVNQISNKTLVNNLAKLNAVLKITDLNHEVYVICKRPKTYPAFVYGVGYFFYALFSFFSWRYYFKNIFGSDFE